MESSLKEILISSYKTDMISFMDTHPEYFDEAIKLAISDEPLFSWRAAWLLWSCMKEDDPRIKGCIKDIIKVVATKDDNHQRELLKILSLMELNGKYESFLFDLCINIWKQIDKKPSVRFNAFKFLVKTAKKHPELSHEVNCLMQDEYLESLSPGARKSVSKIMRGTVGIKIH
jgi:hypothetical protein